MGILDTNEPVISGGFNKESHSVLDSVTEFVGTTDFVGAFNTAAGATKDFMASSPLFALGTVVLGFSLLKGLASPDSLLSIGKLAGGALALTAIANVAYRWANNESFSEAFAGTVRDFVELAGAIIPDMPEIEENSIEAANKSGPIDNSTELANNSGSTLGFGGA
jgi:hypothetical protein